MLGPFFWYVCTSGSDQMAIQRYLATRDVKAARRVLMVAMGSEVVVTLFLAAMGFALLGYYQANPQVFGGPEQTMANADLLFPTFIVLGLPSGVGGLVVSGLLAAAMSSLASGVNSSCSVVTVDLIERFRRHKLTEEQNVRLVRAVSVVVGVIVVALSLYVSLVPGNLLEVCYKVVNLLVAPLFVLFVMALFVPWATSFGTVVAAACSVIAAVLIAYGELIFGRMVISFLWIVPGALLAGTVSGALASLLPIGPRRPMLIDDEPVSR
jgi:SSS family solute:Na+ symporter